LRWDPAPIPKEDMTFLQGVQTMTTAGDAGTQAGMAAHVYLITSMVDQHFYNADGEMMFVLQQGNLRFVTEFGRIDAEPGEIVVIPRGVKFRVELTGGLRAAISARIMAAPSRCRSAGRSAPIASPMRATSSRRWPPMRTRTRRPNSM
jgi:homogentisate 1,2-dioxygenase